MSMSFVSSLLNKRDGILVWQTLKIIFDPKFTLWKYDIKILSQYGSFWFLKVQ